MLLGFIEEMKPDMRWVLRKLKDKMPLFYTTFSWPKHIISFKLSRSTSTLFFSLLSKDVGSNADRDDGRECTDVRSSRFPIPSNGWGAPLLLPKEEGGIWTLRPWCH